MTRLMVAVPLVPLLPSVCLERNPGGYFMTNATSPGESRPVQPERNSSGQTRLYGMATLVPSFWRLPCESLGALTGPSAVMGLPRKAGRLVPKPVGRPVMERLTPA